jgi:hypothetical protein
MPAGLLGMLGLIALIETGVARDVLDFSDPTSLNWRLAARAARDEAPGRAVLCVGDSLVKHGMIPKVIAARSGRDAINLAMARGPAPATFFVLRRALEAGASPSALIVDFKPSILVGSPRYNLRYWQEILTPPEGFELARSSGSYPLFFETAVGWLLPSFRSRHEIRSNLLAALKGETDVLRLINQTCRRNWALNDGANVAAKNPSFTGEVGPDDDKKLLTHVFHCHRVNADYIRRLFALADSRGIRVYWLLPPLSPELQAHREQTGAEAGYVGFVRSFQTRYPNVTVLDGRHAGYDHTLFVDASHLDGQGAYTLSRDVADILRRDLAGASPISRWVDLPDYREYPVEVALEDVEQSRRKLGTTR